MALKLLTRTSPLAQYQANTMSQMVGSDTHIITQNTTPDIKQNYSLPALGYQSSFCHELDQAVLKGHADIACHSLKDTPLNYPTGLKIIAISKREDPRDAWVSDKDPKNLNGLQVGTSSLRRKMLLEHYHPQSRPCVIRGNIGTRLSKLGKTCDGLILAAAGLHRMNLQKHIATYFPIETFIPPPGQGFMALVAREDHAINIQSQDQTDWETAMIERYIARSIGISCHEPAGIYVEKNEQFQCCWFVGDLTTKQLYYGQCVIPAFKNLSQLDTEIEKWQEAHAIPEILKYNRDYIDKIAELIS